jgi:hypothetical protein
MGGTSSSFKKTQIPEPVIVKNPGSIYFDSAYLSIPNNNINLLNKNFSIEFWFYAKKSNNGWIFNNGSFGIGYEDNILKYLWNGEEHRLQPESAPLLNKWVFIRICFDILTNTLNYFINNISTNIPTGSPLTTPPTTDFIIGNNLDNNNGFIGYITDFRITFDNLCQNNTTPIGRLSVKENTVLLISPVDTNPYSDLTKKNDITNNNTRFVTDYPIEGFQLTNESLKMYLFILLIIICIFILLNQFQIIRI